MHITGAEPSIPLIERVDFNALGSQSREEVVVCVA
jgi:hypothetical protein